MTMRYTTSWPDIYINFTLISIFKNGVLSCLKRTDVVVSIEEMFRKSDYKWVHVIRLRYCCTNTSIRLCNLLGIYPLTMGYDANFTVLSLLTGEIQKCSSLHVKISWECTAVTVNETTGSPKVVFTWWCSLSPFLFVTDKLKYSIAWPSQRNGGDHFSKIELELGYSMVQERFCDNGESE